MAMHPLMRPTVLLTFLAVFGVDQSRSWGQTQEIKPNPANRVAGIVLDRAGQAVTGAKVVGAFDLSDEMTSTGPEQDDSVTATTDGSGRFILHWPDRSSRRQTASVWVYRDGFRLARVSVAQGILGEPIQINLVRVISQAGASLQVVGPQGKSIAGAQVVPRRWFEGDVVSSSTKTWAIPDTVADQLARPTDSQGQVLFDSLPALRLAAVVVVDDHFGRQIFRWDETLSPRHREVWLRAVGRIVGQVHADDPSALAGASVRVVTMSGSKPVGLGTTTIDERGHFEIHAIAAGPVNVVVVPRSGSMTLANPLPSQVVQPDQTLSLIMTTHHGVRVVGKVIQRGKHEPVAGATIRFHGPGPTDLTTHTDSDGRFSAVIGSGAVTATVQSAPSPLLIPAREARPREVVINPDRDHFDWPTIELDQGVIIRGQILDEKQQPMASKAIVEARWTRRDGRTSDEMIIRCSTDSAGRFELGPIPPGVELDVRAHLPAGLESEPLRTTADKVKDNLVLILPTPCRLLSPTGRVVDAGGRPVGGALVQIRVVDPESARHGPRPGRRLAVDGLEAVVTDEEGLYRGAPRLDPRRSYLASAEAADCESGRTRPLAQISTDDFQIHFPDLVLDRQQVQSVLVGRVVGSDGQPIAGVEVHDLANHRTQTSESGWFRLEKNGDHGSALLFASKPGYRFSGRSLAYHSDEPGRLLTLVLIRSNEPQTRHLEVGSASSGVSRLATDLMVQSMVVNPFMDQLLAKHDLVYSSALLEVMAANEPLRVLTWLDAGVMRDRRIADGLRRIAAHHLAATDFNAAMTSARFIETASTRILATLDSIEATNLIDDIQKRTTLDQLTREARSVEDLTQRGMVLTRLAESWLKAAETHRARECLTEAQSIAEILPRSSSGAKVSCALIGPLAQVDPDRARELLARLVDPADLDHCRLAVALRWARVRPAEAVAMFLRIRDPKFAGRSTAEICYQLAPVNLMAARGLVDRITTSHPSTAAHALGMMASSLAESDRTTAIGLLHEAYARLEAITQADKSSGIEPDLPPAVVAAVLLPTVERVEPTLLLEMFWKSVALQTKKSAADPHFIAILALMLDRYDHDVARHLFDPGRLHFSLIAPGEFTSFMLAAAQIAPEVTCQWVHSRHDLTPRGQLPPSSDLDPSQLEIVAALTATNLDRWHQATSQLLHLWTPDVKSAIH